MHRIKQWLLKLFKYGFESPHKATSEGDISTHSRVHIILIDANSIKLDIEVLPYEHGATSIRGINKYTYSLRVNTKEILRFRPRPDFKFTTGVIEHKRNSTVAKTILVQSYKITTPDYAKHFIKATSRSKTK